MNPERWEFRTTAELCQHRIVYGIVQAGKHIDDGIPYLKSSNIGGRINVSVLQRTHPEIHQKFRRSTVIPGDVVFSLRGNTGECSIVPNELMEANLTQGTARISVKEDVSNEFVRYQFHSYECRRKINAIAKGSTFREVSLTDLRKLKLLVPPLLEQKKIAEILSTWDRAIEVTEKLLENAITQKRALMQQLLTAKTRFPEFEGQDWREVGLKDVGKIISGGTPDTTREEFWNGDVLWATPTDITKLTTRHIRSTKRMISREGLKKSSARLVPEGSLLVCTRATIAELAISKCPISTNQGFKTLVPKSKFNVEFLFYLFSFYKHIFVRYACGSTFLELSKKDFAKLTFSFPPIQEQQKIANTLNTIVEEAEQHVRTLTKLRSEKKALMQQMLTGKRRVKV